jgi:hypothetical protein
VRRKRWSTEYVPTKVFMSRTQWKVSIWEKVEMSIGKLRFGNTTPNMFASVTERDRVGVKCKRQEFNHRLPPAQAEKARKWFVGV